MKRLIVSFLTIAVFSCGTGPTESSEAIRGADSSIVNQADKRRLVETDTITLLEYSMEGIPLPFEEHEMLSELRETFNGLIVAKEVGKQDGPDFPLYSLKNRSGEICFFAMNSEDTLMLDKIHVKQPIVKDQYGLKIGDSYQKIKELRGDSVKTFTNYHRHTYAYFETSNIMYEITGDLSLPDTVDLEELKLTEDQIKDWTIEYLIWTK